MAKRHLYSKVGILMGGMSSERDVSLSSGQAVARALEARGYDVVPIELPTSGRDAARLLAASNIDVAFLALHGRQGEDGCVQGLLEMLGIPYTGSSVLSSALAMDKLKAKEMFRLHNVPTPPYYAIGADDDLADLETLHGSFGFPVMVKPRGEGSSLGVAKATHIGELAQSIDAALRFDDSVIVERFIGGTEVNVGLLDGHLLGAIEIVPRRPFYDFDAKYREGLTEFHLPARLPKTRLRGLLNLAQRAAGALGCRGACRVDLIVTPGENEFVLEVNTLPGMTPTSLLPKIAQSAGYDFETLCESILSGARCDQPTKKARPAATSEGLPAPLRLARSA